jgi:ABC-type nickel/cobalt efflux system permease component RcnA
MLRRLVVAGALSVAVLLALPAAPALAHPLGNFTVNTYTGVAVRPGEVLVRYVLDLAEVPTFEEMATIDGDGDGDGAASPGELRRWAGQKAGDLRAGLRLVVDGASAPLGLLSSEASVSPGQGGLSVIRLEAAYRADAPASGHVSFADGNFADQIGWREVTAVGLDGRAVSGSSVPTRSVSDELREYPDDLLSNPLDVTEATFSFRPGGAGDGAATKGGGSTGEGSGTAGGGFASLVSRPELSVGVVLLSLALALGFGALHALAPGHGKTLMAAYLVGVGARTKQAVAVGVAVAVMHTASVLGLGVVILSAQRVFPAERAYPWLGLGAGLTALALGAWLMIARLQAWSAGRDQDRAHAAAEDPRPEQAHGHVHRRLPAGASLLSRRGLGALAVSGGLLPSPAALLVLLGAVATHRVAYGLVLIAAFSVGLAGALTAVGVLAVRARDLVSRGLGGRLARGLPIASSAVIVAVGAVLTLQAIAQL